MKSLRGAHFLRLACQGGRRKPLLPVSYATVDYLSRVLFLKCIPTYTEDVLFLGFNYVLFPGFN